MEQVPTQLYEYGVLGILVAIFAYALWQQWHRVNKRNDMLEKRIDNLQEQFRTYLQEEKLELMQVVKDNTSALEELKTAMQEMFASKPKSARKPKDTAK